MASYRCGCEACLPFKHRRSLCLWRRRDISGVIEEINRLQDVWLSRQSELVALDKRSEREQERMDELRTKHAIFCDKQYRLNADVEARQGEVVKQVRLQDGDRRLNTYSFVVRFISVVLGSRSGCTSSCKTSC